MRSQCNRPRSISRRDTQQTKRMSFRSKTAEDITLIFYIRWAVDAIESLYVALRIVKRRPVISTPFVEILSLPLQNDTTGRMEKAFV